MPASRRKTRNFDRESGKNRVSPRDKKPAPVESDSEEYLSSDSDLESDLDIPAKDDTRRKDKKSAPPARKGNRQDGRSRAIKGEEDSGDKLADDKKTETSRKVAPHMAILTAATYHMGLSSIARPSVSSFIPSAMNLFAMVNAILAVVVDNTMLHEMSPEFFSPLLTLYYGHVFYYHILRARNAAGSDVLTRLERRALTYYERVGPAEAWPIAAPLLGFFQYIGSHKTEDPMYSWIVPALPDFSKLKSGGTPNCLGSLDQMTGSARIPPIPALQKLVYNFAHNIADFENGILRPIGQNGIDATHTFCGITSSAITSNAFLSLTGNVSWNAPQDTGEDVGQFDYDIKRARIRRWNVPDVPDNTDCSTLTGFLGFVDNQSFDWMRHLLTTSAVVNRFFPGSGNLSQISPYTTLGSATLESYISKSPPTPIKDHWFYPKTNLFVGSYGFTNSEVGLLDTKMAITVSPNARYSTENKDRVTVAPNASLSPERTGPFFIDDPAFPAIERAAQIITENSNQVSPTTRFEELLVSHYDNRAGRS